MADTFLLSYSFVQKQRAPDTKLYCIAYTPTDMFIALFRLHSFLYLNVDVLLFCQHIFGLNLVVFVVVYVDI